MLVAKKASKWIQLPTNEISDEYFTIPMKINRYEFIITAMDGVHKFNMKDDKWSELYSYSSTINRYHAATYDLKTNVLYICGGGGIEKMNIIDLNTKKEASYSHVNIGNYSRCVIIKNDLHVIGGTATISHFIWNKKTNKLDEINKLIKVEGLNDFGLIYVKSKDIMLLFGGFDNSSYEETNKMHQYSMTKNEWNILDVKMPKCLCGFGCVLTNDEKYVLIFGGSAFDDDDESNFCDDIFVFDINKRLFTKSITKCPSEGEFHTILTNNHDDDKLLVNGYIRDLNMSIFIPMEIQKFIETLYCNEYVYLLERTGADKHFWKIAVDDIMCF